MFSLHIAARLAKVRYFCGHMKHVDSNKRVLIGMSGGIDSSAACMILQEQGYEVVGLTMRMWDLPRHFPHKGQTTPQFALEARELAEKIGIEHHILDVREEFRGSVIKSFIDEYLKGKTPNPCVMCNRQFKWHYLLQEADRLGCHWVATGHYARILQENGYFVLGRGADAKKDQSYFLWRLGQQELSRTIFPLGDITKEEIKKYVEGKGFHEKVEKKESMEVCFIPNDYRDFLREQLPDLDRQVAGGYFVDALGRKLGQHKGFPFYTIGQRKGLEIALGKPMFVTRINPVKNTIRLGEREELLTRRMVISEVIEAIPDSLENSGTVDVQIRYRSAAIPATLQKGETPGEWLVLFQHDASAVTPGQSAVIYRDNRIIGGGIIADQRLLKKYSS